VISLQSAIQDQGESRAGFELLSPPAACALTASLVQCKVFRSKQSFSGLIRLGWQWMI
jgi:hypothetical protein